MKKILFSLLILIAQPCFAQEAYTVKVTRIVDAEVGPGIRIFGTIKNNTSKTFTSAYTDIKLYDAEGQLLDLGYSVVHNSHGVLPGHTALWVGGTSDDVVHASDVKSALAVLEPNSIGKFDPVDPRTDLQ